MKITLMAAGNVLGMSDWDYLPSVGKIILLQSANTQAIERRSVDRIEDDPTGGKIVHLGGAQPTSE